MDKGILRKREHGYTDVQWGYGFTDGKGDMAILRGRRDMTIRGEGGILIY